MLKSGVPAFKIIETHLQRVKKLIDEQMTGPIEAGNISRLLHCLRRSHSKMTRSGLALLSGMCCGRITEEHIRIAAVVEIIHTAMLLHDGVVNKCHEPCLAPSVSSLCSNETAVLVGDFLLGRVFQMCARLSAPANEIIAGAAARICEGQLRHIAQRNNWQLSESEYIDIITEKNALLFSTACRLGALLAQGNKLEAESLAQYGLNTGIVHQIADDLLEAVNDRGQNAESYQEGGYRQKLGLPVIHLLSSAGREEKEAIINLCSGAKDIRYEKNTLVNMLRTNGSLEYAQIRVRDFVTESIEALGPLKENRTGKVLIETVKFVAGRTGWSGDSVI
jgi:octaprenyl-diphosphate synthase